MADHKPLPAIPVVATAPNLTTLSVEARAHRGRFIRHILSEAELDDGEGSWAAALEDALDTLSDAVARGRWLTGVKKGRRERAPLVERKPMARTDTMSSSASSALQSVVSDASAESLVAFPQSPAVESLRTIRALAAQPAPPNPKPEPRHLLLCLAPLGSRIAVPSEDSGFDLVPANVGCVFKPTVFSLPEEDSDEPSSILYGLAEWDAATPDVKLVGGTFAFKGVNSPLQHHALCKALRIFIYMHLSLLLEQHFLCNSRVRLEFPLPKLRHSAVSYQPSLSPSSNSQVEPTPPRLRQNKTFLPGILSFFSKKNTALQMHRTHTVSSTSTRSGASLDLSSTSSSLSSSRDSTAPASPAPRLSADDGSRIRRFSFLGPSTTPSFLKPSSPGPAPAPAPDTPAFTALLARLRAAAPLLSSSAGAAHPARRLLGDEKAGLASILGWDAAKAAGERARAMGGARGFARMQEMSVLVSRHVPCARTPPGSVSGEGSTSTLGGEGEQQQRALAACCAPRWRTYRYYSRGEGEGDGDGEGGDRSLGEMVRSLSGAARAPCGRAGCAFVQGEHVLRIVHGGVRVEVAVEADERRGSEGERGEMKETVGEKGKEKDKEKKEKEKEKAGGASAKDKDKDKEKAGDAKENDQDTPTDAANTDDARIEMWVSCAVCGKRTDRMEMNDGTYLFSFAKFLEVLVYSPAICTLSPALCAHTSPPPPPPRVPVALPSSPTSTPTASTVTSASTVHARREQDEAAPALPASRFNIVRHFAVGGGHRVSFALSPIDDVFELRVPRLQITRKIGDKDKGSGASSASARSSIASGVSGASGGGPAPVDEEKRALRREIKAWWEGVADHLDKLETTIVGSTLVGFRKALPRLPSVDDAYDDFDSASEDDDDTDDASEDATTPKLTKPHSIAGLPPSAPSTPQITRTAQEFFPASSPPLTRASTDPTAVSPARSPPPPPSGDPIELLASLRQTFHGAEQALYTQLAQTPVSALNDVRRAFAAAAHGAQRRLAAWQAKHVVLGPGRSNKKRLQKMEMELQEPEWWAKGCHTAPGTNIIVREDDWGSIIAFTMSTADYARELASMSLVRASATSSPAALLTPTPAAATSSASSFFSAKVGPSNYKLFASSTQTQPDPDQADAVWYEPEAYSAVISRKEHPRDVTSLLSLREVLRQKAPIDGTGLLSGSSSRFNSLGSAATKSSSVAGIVPPSAWSKPDVQISRHAAGGEVSESGESAGKILHEIDASTAEDRAPGSRPGSALSGSFLAGSMFADIHIKRGKAASVISVDSDTTIGGQSKEDDSASVIEAAAGTEEAETKGKANTRHGKDATAATIASETPTPTQSSFTNTLTSGISNAMRLLLSSGEIPRPSMFSKNHHGLLASADASAIDERPHIKYDWTVGKRLKFSCTVYYAKQFDNLRKRCGIEDVFIKSLSRSANWAAEGGKSKSNFWKTADDRFIIKTLVNAWNVADLQVLIELAPSYFRYMDATASRATVLAKLIGFYTIEIRNLESGTVQSKADLLVMENLFYDQKIVKTFDLKGIQGRKVKSNASGTAKDKTLFDGEWIEGQQRTLTLVRPHSKVVLREAIKSDAEFLAKSNIMDYSLLLGVDQERKEIACGLVDTIGSYTFAKTLEYKAKQGLTGNSGKEVTVIPPTEYQERFVSALDGYFVACPDKWSRSMDDTKPINDPGQLPSVL
ncbi:hypothetical protein B0H19DRAFT_1271776 [Mycena capillaripes]|nr:hypothetical protein B0H19DRAFT_1271776 [Mycena capillaripes]